MSMIGFSVAIEKSDISNSINSAILLIFGMGMYTVVYIGTMYIYLTRGLSNHRIVPATITMLFLCNIVQTGVQWYSLKWQFIDNGTRDSVFASVFEGPSWAYLVLDIPYFMGFVLADGLLIWRCFYVWNRSFRVVSMPLLLIITESALFLVQIVFAAVFRNFPPVTLIARLNHLLSASFFTTFVTSLLTTVLITYRIYSVSNQEGVSQRRFKHIIDVVVQSGAAYSLSLLVAAITIVLPGAGVVTITWAIALELYVQQLTNLIGGISTTILVARVSTLATDATFPSTSVHISSPQFNAHSTQQAAPREGMENSDSVGVNGNSAGEREDIEGKVQ